MNTNIVMIYFGIFYIIMAACLGFSTAAIINLRKDIKADKQLFKIILDKTNEITNHCNKVLQLMDGTIDMLRKEHELHSQAVDAMNEVKAAADAMMSDFGELKDELDICRDQIVKLNNRLDEFDALKYINGATTTPYTLVNTATMNPNTLVNTTAEPHNIDITKQFVGDGEDDGK